MSQEEYRKNLTKGIKDNLTYMQELIDIIRDELQKDKLNKAYKDTELLQRMSVGTIGLLSGMVTIDMIKETGGFE